jgi:hypothetical protein
MVRQISRVDQTIICPFPFEHEACLDSTEKQNSNAMGARIRGFKNPRIQEAEALAGKQLEAANAAGKKHYQRGPRLTAASRILESLSSSRHRCTAAGRLARQNTIVRPP